MPKLQIGDVVLYGENVITLTSTQPSIGYNQFGEAIKIPATGNISLVSSTEQTLKAFKEAICEQVK